MSARIVVRTISVVRSRSPLSNAQHAALFPFFFAPYVPTPGRVADFALRDVNVILNGINILQIHLFLPSLYFLFSERA